MNIKIYFIFALAFLSISCSKEDITDPGQDPGLSEGFTAEKSGTFSGLNGYSTSGSADLGSNQNALVVLRLNDDFKTSFATGSVTVYLTKTNQLDLGDAASFFKAGVINQSGLHYLAAPAEALNDFSYVIIWCAPAGIAFGRARLE